MYDIFTRGNSEGGPNFTLKFGTLGFCAPEDTYTISAFRKVFHMLKNAKKKQKYIMKGTNASLVFELKVECTRIRHVPGRGIVRLDL